MSISRIWKAVRSLPLGRTLATQPKMLREFVYLDAVSVYSILASLKSGIATQFTENRAASIDAKASGSVSAGFGVAGAKIENTAQAGLTHGSQVVRQAIVQSTFTELYDTVDGVIDFGIDISKKPPQVDSVHDIVAAVKSRKPDDWVINPADIARGQLLQVEVELQADDVFKVAEFVDTVRDFIETNNQVVDQHTKAQIPEIRSMAKVMDTLLTGLVPIRGRLINYMCVEIDGHELLVHRSILNQIAEDCKVESCPVFVVGVAERNLFWKDIRRVLFSSSRYTMFCRMSVDGLTNSWQPLKVVDVLDGIVPGFGEIFKKFGSFAREAMSSSVAKSPVVQHDNDTVVRQVISNYCRLLADEHQAEEPEGFVDRMLAEVAKRQGWMDTVASRRAVFRDVASCFDGALDVQTTPETVSRLRSSALADIEFETKARFTTSRDENTGEFSKGIKEKFLDVEIVAIYW